MIKSKAIALIIAVIVVASLVGNSSCKSCNKDKEVVKPVDTVATTTPVKVVDLARADSALMPLVKEVLEKAFDASKRKDYATLGSLIIYRGDDTLRYGVDVHNVKNADEKRIVQITADVFNKWTNNTTTIDYSRFMQQPLFTGDTMLVLEVYFMRQKGFDRKFFGFIDQGGGDYKILDVASQF
jgi:hypothetical protein